MPRSARKTREIERIRHDILEAAARAFAASGYAKVTMEDIAREAGYAVGSLYNYFKGKAEIRRALFEAIVEQLASVPHDDPAIATLPYRQRLEWRLRRHLEVVAANRPFFTMFYGMRGTSDAGGTDHIPLLLRDTYLREIDQAAEEVRQGMAEGSVREDNDINDLKWFLAGAIDSTIFRWTLGELPGELVDHAATLTELIFNGIGKRD